MAYHISIIPLYTVLYSISIMTRDCCQKTITRARHAHFVFCCLLYTALLVVPLLFCFARHPCNTSFKSPR